MAGAPKALTFHANDALLQLVQQPIQCCVVGHLEGMGLTGVRGNQLQFPLSLSLVKCISHLHRGPGSVGWNRGGWLVPKPRGLYRPRESTEPCHLAFRARYHPLPSFLVPCSPHHTLWAPVLPIYMCFPEYTRPLLTSAHTAPSARRTLPTSPCPRPAIPVCPLRLSSAPSPSGPLPRCPSCGFLECPLLSSSLLGK